jgi:hypothetical protein
MRMATGIRTLAAGLVLSCASSAAAADYDFYGTFTRDDEVAVIPFSVPFDSTVTLFTSSWQTGDSRLGFDPILTVWDAVGGKLVQQDDSGEVLGTAVSNGTSYDYGFFDNFLTVSLPAGSYLATLTQFSNYSVDSLLANGFTYDGVPNFTFLLGFGSAPFFNGVWSGDDPRTGDWALHIIDVHTTDPTLVPDGGSTAAALAAALAGLWCVRRRK